MASSEDQDGKINTCSLTVKGMTCSSCVAQIEKALRKRPGIIDPVVSLMMSKAIIHYDNTQTNPTKIAEFISDMGFPSSVDGYFNSNSCCDEIVLSVEDLSLDSMKLIEDHFREVLGVENVYFYTSTSRIRFDYNPELIGVRNILSELKKLNVSASPLSDYWSSINIAFLSHKEEVRKWRNAFLFNLAFGLPPMALMMYYMYFANKPHHGKVTHGGGCCVLPGLSMQNLLLLLLVTPVQFFGGRYFYVQAYKSLIQHAANMDVLIMLATNVAYFYSVSVLIAFMINGKDHSPKTFFDTPPMLLIFVSLGRWMEHIAKGKTSEALTKLMSLQPHEACVVTWDEDEKRILSENLMDAQLVQKNDYLKVLPGTKVPVDDNGKEEKSQWLCVL